jgi:hypothetical protein
MGNLVKIIPLENLKDSSGIQLPAKLCELQKRRNMQYYVLFVCGSTPELTNSLEVDVSFEVTQFTIHTSVPM